MLDDNGLAKTTRERVLQTLLTQQRCTVDDIAKAVNINPISVRHHINRLEADGLVKSEEVRHGVGRPHRLYFLTDAGHELFPARYLRLTLRLLQQLKETVPLPIVNRLFAEMARDLAANYSGDLDKLTIEQRLDLVKQLLTNEGFNVNWEKQGEFFHIQESNCPYYYIGQNHPEVCSVDQTLISTVLNLPAEKVQCMLQGDSTCTFIVPSVEYETKESA